MDGPTYAHLNAVAIVGMSPNTKALSDSERAGLTDHIATDSLAVVAKYSHDGGFQFTLTKNFATARA